VCFIIASPPAYYLRALVGTDASVLIVPNQCDSARDRTSHPSAKVDDFSFLRSLVVSAKTGLGLNLSLKYYYFGDARLA
jgi:hypothetical protein